MINLNKMILFSALVVLAGWGTYLSFSPIQQNQNTETQGFRQIIEGEVYTNKEEAQKAYAALLKKQPYLPQEKQGATPKSSGPAQAARQDALATMDPALGNVPSERLYNSVSQVNKQVSEKAVTGKIWTERGPKSIAGRTRALMFDPNTKNKVWAGSVSGGLWYKNNINDNRQEWQPVNDFWANLAVTSIVAHPTSKKVYYVGTGEGFLNSDAVRGAGIWKTTNAGATWTQLSSTKPTAKNKDFEYVNDLLIVGGKGGGIIAATRTGIHRSTDGGKKWTKIKSYAYSELELSKNNDVYAANFAGEIIKSTNKGKTFGKSLTPGNLRFGGRVEIACAPSNNNILYAVSPKSPDFGGGAAWMIKSMDGGATWDELDIPHYTKGGERHPFTGDLGWYSLIMTVHPTNPNLVVMGGIHLYRTLNGGNRWTKISEWDTNGPAKNDLHPDQHQLIFNPNNSIQLLIGNDGGVYTSNAGKASVAKPGFTNRNQGYNVTQFYASAMKPVSGSNYFLAGAQDNGVQKFTKPGFDETELVKVGDGGFCHIDEDDPTKQITARNYGLILISANNGKVFERQYFTDPSDDKKEIGLFINPSDYDSRSDNLFFGYRSGEYAVLKITNGVDDKILDYYALDPSNKDPKPITHIKVSPHKENKIFVGTQDGHLYKIVDGANVGNLVNPKSVEINTKPLPTGTISCIEIGASWKEILVTFSNYGVKSVWQTKNEGKSWTNIEGNLPDIPVRWAIYNPSRTKILLATELGVFITNKIDGSKTKWINTGSKTNGLANVRCNMIEYRKADGLVLVTTHGRGLWTGKPWSATIKKTNGEIWVAADPEESQIEKIKTIVYPNALTDAQKTHLKTDLKHAEIRLLDNQGRTRMGYVGTIEEIENKLNQIKQTLKPGYYYLKVIGGGKQETIRLKKE